MIWTVPAVCWLPKSSWAPQMTLWTDGRGGKRDDWICSSSHNNGSGKWPPWRLNWSSRAPCSSIFHFHDYGRKSRQKKRSACKWCEWCSLVKLWKHLSSSEDQVGRLASFISHSASTLIEMFASAANAETSISLPRRWDGSYECGTVAKRTL